MICLKFIISHRGNHCDYSHRASKEVATQLDPGTFEYEAVPCTRSWLLALCYEKPKKLSGLCDNKQPKIRNQISEDSEFTKPKFSHEFRIIIS
jgi:hypothetical protein